MRTHGHNTVDTKSGHVKHARRALVLLLAVMLLFVATSCSREQRDMEQTLKQFAERDGLTLAKTYVDEKYGVDSVAEQYFLIKHSQLFQDTYDDMIAVRMRVGDETFGVLIDGIDNPVCADNWQRSEIENAIGQDYLRRTGLETPAAISASYQSEIYTSGYFVDVSSGSMSYSDLDIDVDGAVTAKYEGQTDDTLFDGIIAASVRLDYVDPEKTLAESQSQISEASLPDVTFTVNISNWKESIPADDRDDYTDYWKDLNERLKYHHYSDGDELEYHSYTTEEIDGYTFVGEDCVPSEVVVRTEVPPAEGESETLIAYSVTRENDETGPHVLMLLSQPTRYRRYALEDLSIHADSEGAVSQISLWGTSHIGDGEYACCYALLPE